MIKTNQTALPDALDPSPMQNPADVLRQSLTLTAETLPNRLAKAAMTEGLAGPDCRPNQRHVTLYDAFARGGAGLLITGNVIIDRKHLERPGNVVIDAEPDAQMRAALSAWSHAAQGRGAGVWMQISHAGRQTPRIVNPRPKSASAIGLQMPGKQFATPQAMTEGDIEAVIFGFTRAARVARETGFSGVQVHAAHGYLLSQFLSPLVNRRDDAWGGALAGRARLLMEVVRSVRAAVGADFTVSVKLNSADFQKGGFAPEESLTVAGWLRDARVDCLEISGGSYEQPRMMNMEGLTKPDLTGLPASTAAREAYFLDFAAMMTAQVSLPLMVTGGFRTAAAMAQAVTRDGVALIGLGRPLCVDPMAPSKLLAGAPGVARSEETLRIGPGWLGPKSPFKLVKAANGFGQTYWYYQQLRRMGEGQPPDLTLKLLDALKREQNAQAALAAQLV
jgi:2,4-dienoyl-CoA reductase-like NADH-dependent reductase (Old Yellow Enzyme family)